MSEVSIYHNPRCSKSRQTLALLEDKGIKPQVIEYLKEPLTAEDIQGLLRKLGFVSARELMRSKEEAYKELNLKDEEDESKLIEAMLSHPKLIERPIVVKGSKARLGRPPEAVEEIL
ncbi:arsenate reductase (glutaredoxin) [Pseudidiomarina terrestris]|uniref:Arsenate reductase n=1 Tax=Pseudidiomarina terrestris TaxID=2820060 RepID=A0AAW7QZX0_9GAMM|nr:MULTISPECIES: arsenate reductase (glutaredoxin) [unclassified Pseudidiomarina]MDN7124096.1 arsenate reductase (glutaredoxin) [Pseudidiomarina sp. 1APP75-32.1]MDN7127168.1 arsenate reductase (glutaredoxin) [Pseudidiomarina sp. 1APR75-33.1]MDN7128353.1 arsenate reductase (glutaredoxin) [Pseudidiomarina sp. 1APR75-15]MDN7135419.1 arsenate reductase (glutaredoxin) [Pseudidiomarina sp. 1ASP75-5]MEA3586843.1 arsenate reductase (glutaredoxin) [Pseudidiomarina sp. 1APP75-27a]